MRKYIIGIIVGIVVVFIIGTIALYYSFSFKLNGKRNITLNFGEEYKEEGAKLSLLGKDESSKIKIKGNVDTSKIGTYKIAYIFDVFGLKITEERTVKVMDDIAPSIELSGEEEVTICPNSEYEEEGYVATDNYDGDITDKVQKITDELGNIKYKVTDSSDNSYVIERRIKKEDKEAPKITLKGNTVMQIKKNTSYQDAGYDVSDNCDNNIKVNVDSNVNTNELGTYYVKYTATDSSNNITTVTRTVKVVNEEDSTGVIYLTFDDGPSGSGSTAKILDVLKKYDVKATFFVTGSGPDSLIKREYEEGHTVALHTYSHDYANVYASVDNFFNDLTKIQNRVYNITGNKSTITRFPGGSNNTINKKYNNYNGGIMGTLRSNVLERGFTYYDWNVNDADSEYKTSGNPTGCLGINYSDSVNCVYRNVVNNLSKRRANMVLMHDIKNQSADALENIITYAKNNGYEFRAITENTPQVKFN